MLLPKIISFNNAKNPEKVIDFPDDNKSELSTRIDFLDENESELPT